MTIAQNRNSELVALQGVDLLPLSDRNLYFSAYDSQDQTFSDNDPHILGYDTVHQSSSTDAFVLAGDVLTINVDGMFLFMHHIAVKQDAYTGLPAFRAWLERDTGAGYVGLLGSFIRVMTHQTEYISGSASLITSVRKGYKYRIQAARSAGADPCTVLSDGRGMRWVCLVGLQ